MPKTLNLALLVPALPMVKLTNGREVQLVGFSAEAYEIWKDVQAMIDDEKHGRPVDVPFFHESLDKLVQSVIPDATADERAKLGARTEAKLALVLAAAGQIDTVIASLEALEAGKDATGQSTPRSDPRTTSARRSSRTPSGSAKSGRKRSGG